MNEKLKDFYLKGIIREIKTGKTHYLDRFKIQGYFGDDAVNRYADSLREEGIYELTEDYSYCQVSQ